MENLKKNLLLTFLLVATPITPSPGNPQDNQEVRLKGVPSIIAWNLHPDIKHELQLKDFEYPVRFDDDSIWSTPKNPKIEPVGLTPKSFGFNQRTFDYQKFVSSVTKEGKYSLFPAWGVPQLYLVTGYDGNAFWIPTEETMRGREIARIGSNTSKAYTSSARSTEFFADNPKRSRVSDIWLFIRARK